MNPSARTSLLRQHRSALVLGLGITGYSVVRFLSQQGIRVVVMDSRAAPPLAAELAGHFPEVMTFFGGFDVLELDQHSLVVASPGIDLSQEVFKTLKQSGVTLIGDIELFVLHNSRPLIAITGSNGKSTVTTLVGEICLAAGLKPLVAGNIGRPALDALTEQKEFDVAVLELSSFQLETTTSVPAQVSAILNISQDHQDRYASMGDYVLAKARILRGAKRAVLPRHSDTLNQITNVNEVYTFGLDEPDGPREFGLRRHKNARWLMRGDDKLIKLRELPLLGLHNVENVLAALALVDFLDLPQAATFDAIRDFRGLPHRMQTVASDQGITWVNDSKATNIGAAASALRSLERDVIWIAGGQGKGADFDELRTAIRANIKHLILLGEDADLIANALQDALPIARVSDMQAAVRLAGDLASPDMVVLLSPACASFDMYASFAHRGDDFCQQVNQWLTERAA